MEKSRAEKYQRFLFTLALVMLALCYLWIYYIAVRMSPGLFMRGIAAGQSRKLFGLMLLPCSVLSLAVIMMNSVTEKLSKQTVFCILTTVLVLICGFFMSGYAVGINVSYLMAAAIFFVIPLDFTIAAGDMRFSSGKQEKTVRVGLLLSLALHLLFCAASVAVILKFTNIFFSFYVVFAAPAILLLNAAVTLNHVSGILGRAALIGGYLSSLLLTIYTALRCFIAGSVISDLLSLPFSLLVSLSSLVCAAFAIRNINKFYKEKNKQ